MTLLKYIATLLIMGVFSINSLADTTSSPLANPDLSAADKPKDPIPSRLWNLQDADIQSIINEVSLETGKNFIVDPRVTGKISLISSKPIKPNEVYDLFLSVLGILGYSAIPTGNVVKIVPNMESTELATRVATSQFPGKGDELVVRVIPLENITASQLIPILRPLLPQWSSISAYTPGNVLILLGRASNLKRLNEIIRDVDKASSNNIDIIPLRQTSAGQLANVLTNLQNAARSSGDTPQVSIAPDERSNSILISGNRAARLRTRVLISQLDVPSAGAEGNTQVVYLRYLQAKDFAPILGKIAQNILSKDNTSTMGVVSSSPQNYPGGAGGSQTKVPENTTSIQAEPNTNAIIITAPPRLMHTLSSIVAKLDIRPAQVLVEGIIVELSQNDTKTLGIQWGSLSNTNKEQNIAANGFLPLGIGSVGIIPRAQIQAILGVLQQTSGANILSTPSIVVLDNQKATLAIGTQVTDQTGSYTTTGSTPSTPFNTFNRLNVELKLDVTPQINLGHAVRLKIVLKNDSLQNPSNPGLNPVINTSSITNSVIVNNDDILVLGGLISNNITETTDKIPILGDLPFIGPLFKLDSRTLQKKNLLVFIKPTIIHTTEDAQALTHMKYDVSRNAQIAWPEELFDEGHQKLENILPPYKNNVRLPKPFENDDNDLYLD